MAIPRKSLNVFFVTYYSSLLAIQHRYRKQLILMIRKYITSVAVDNAEVLAYFKTCCNRLNIKHKKERIHHQEWLCGNNYHYKCLRMYKVITKPRLYISRLNKYTQTKVASKSQNGKKQPTIKLLVVDFYYCLRYIQLTQNSMFPEAIPPHSHLELQFPAPPDSADNQELTKLNY